MVIRPITPDRAYPRGAPGDMDKVGVRSKDFRVLAGWWAVHGRQGEGSLRMTSKPLSEALEEAFIQSRNMDASLAERLQAFADAVSRLGPHFQAAVDQLVSRLREHERRRERSAAR